MKSIKNFRSTRQALKQSESHSAERPPSSPEEEFPLGPRLFGKSRAVPSKKEPGKAEAPAGTNDTGTEETPLPDSNGLKIISNSEWEMVVRKEKTDAEPEGPGSESKFPVENPPEEAGWDSDEANDTGPRIRAGSGYREIHESDHESDTGESRAVVVRPLEEPSSPAADEKTDVEQQVGDPAAASEEEAPPRRKKPGRPPKSKAPQAAAEKLEPYALRVGSHSYVLVDDEGRLVKNSNTGRKPG